MHRGTSPSITARSFAAQILLTSGTNVILALLGMLTGVLAARLLGPEGRGQLAAIQMWPNFLAGVACLGLPQALTFYSAQSTSGPGRYLGSAMCLGMFASVPVMIVGYASMPGLLPAQSASVVAAARWYLLLLPIQVLESMPHHLLRGRSDFAVWNVVRVVPGVSWLGILAYGWLFQRTDPTFFALMYLAALTLLAAPTFYVVRRRVAGSFLPDSGHWLAMLRYGFPSMLSGVPQVLNLRLDQMLMAALLPAETLGLYVVAVTWSGGVGLIPNALGTVLFPKTASQEEPRERRVVFAQGIRLAVLSAGVVAIVVAGVTPVALPLLFGEKFAASVPAALVLVVAAAIAAVNLVLEEGLRGLGQPALTLWAETGGLVVTGISLLFLLKPLGIMGAAIASVLGYGAVTVTLVVASLRMTGFSAAALLRPGPREIRQICKRLHGLVTPMRTVRASSH
ncbi:MAG TPA: oligosaccharide flippase family protein [Candidatus Margulisiibacteriota bacterium]|nr:oligosaccharide flippase family protein [Candidatus Margulisiibacteriota bacterium]